MTPNKQTVSTRPSVFALVLRGVRRRCPKCGVGPIFRGWFAMHDACENCGRSFGRGPGYLLGSIYFNYGVTAMIVMVAYFVLYFTEVLGNQQRLAVLSLFCLLFPVWFFRYARSLWIAFDECFDPWVDEGKAK